MPGTSGIGQGAIGGPRSRRAGVATAGLAAAALSIAIAWALSGGDDRRVSGSDATLRQDPGAEVDPAPLSVEDAAATVTRTPVDTGRGTFARFVFLSSDRAPLQARWGWFSSRSVDGDVEWAGKTAVDGSIAVEVIANREDDDRLLVEADADFLLEAHVADLRAWPAGRTFRLPALRKIRILFDGWRTAANATVAVSAELEDNRMPLPDSATWSMVFRNRCIEARPGSEVVLAVRGHGVRVLEAEVVGGVTTPERIRLTAHDQEARFAIEWDAKPERRFGLRLLTADRAGAVAPVGGRAWLVQGGSRIVKEFKQGFLAPADGFAISADRRVQGARLVVLDETFEHWSADLGEDSQPIIEFVKGDGFAPTRIAALPFEPKLVVSPRDEGSFWSFEHDRPASGRPWWRQTEKLMILGRVPAEAREIWFIGTDGRVALLNLSLTPLLAVVQEVAGVQTLSASSLPRESTTDNARIAFEVRLPRSSRWIELDAVNWEIGSGSSWHKLRTPWLGGRFTMRSGKYERLLEQW